jgi:hypothetical protein
VEQQLEALLRGQAQGQLGLLANRQIGDAFGELVRRTLGQRPELR